MEGRNFEVVASMAKEGGSMRAQFTTLGCYGQKMGNE